ncbi:hypothetical protein [Sutcliffiella halmapala]|jgi:hypothetical protein|uniref:hypothetical protein n=1 Tax=Sutcliffiella halmapala TaxID=79882 RepID=UPI0009952226|nr:hypothetical protein [Sutcliffiella halmapala]
MSVTLYQARAGDGIKKRGLKRADTFFSTPQEAVIEALALKERMDHTYQNEIDWDYKAMLKGSTSKLKILKGYLGGNRESNPFYLEITSTENDKVKPVSPIKPKNVSKEDKKVEKTVVKFYK